ncbi:uncharacterized protein TRIREDRAFT_104576 [Trichoderma reesei QM6a]|uniref:Predicted protein n=1 Tax=Hypocrea jecorina (strain QM6a) TaxID=431241 RepID=G0RB94_HYPJQ|nr:uncharacterized protein TRIREDRAFT_104576 [Trichoderma reesei QM6a]EGR51564.1 predicted protein [Trichoderma reesei QM6a]
MPSAIKKQVNIKLSINKAVNYLKHITKAFNKNIKFKEEEEAALPIKITLIIYSMLYYKSNLNYCRQLNYIYYLAVIKGKVKNYLIRGTKFKKKVLVKILISAYKIYKRLRNFNINYISYSYKNNILVT